MITRTQYLSGKVRRWHTHHSMEQTNADHCWGVAMILIKLVKPEPSKELLIAALFHDVGEYLAGDMPGYAKQKDPIMKLAMDAAERCARHAIGLTIPSLTEEEVLWLEFADAMEAWLFVRHCGRFTDAEAVEYFPALVTKMRLAATALGLDLQPALGEFVR